jgi:hypothetical protein
MNDTNSNNNPGNDYHCSSSNNNNNNNNDDNSNNNSGSSSSSSSSSNFNAAQELHNSTINSIETQRAIDNARKAATKRKRWADMKTANPERYEESLAKMKNYHQLTREKRLAQQRQYRSNMSEEQKEQRLAQRRQYRSNMSDEQKEQRLAQQIQYRSNMSEEQKEQRLAEQRRYRSNLSDKLIEKNRSNDIQYQHNRRIEMKAAEVQLANSTNLLIDGNDLNMLQGPANNRQRILAQDRNYKSRKWTNIEQTWDEDFPCR